MSVIILAFICLYNCFAHLYIYVKKKQLISLWFASTCFFISLYDIVSAGLYMSDNFIDGMFWQKLQFASLNFVAISFFWFCWTFFQAPKSYIPKTITLIFGLIFVLGMTLPAPYTLSLIDHTPKEIGIINLFRVSVFEGSPGIIYLFEYICLFLGLIFLLTYPFTSKSVQLTNKLHQRVFLLSLGIFALSGFNDILVGLNMYFFIYTTEYAYLCIVVFMTYLLLEHHMQMLTDIEELNIRLEENLDNKTKEVKTLSGLLPICAACNKIRDDNGYWNRLESFIEKNSEAQFSHGTCHECMDKLYQNQEWYKKEKLL